ncbi:hypothetical protein HanRHA438_Chr16g0744811 [Helianthus annuus]|uniref:Uncharacterized protein n=1 Tax=Helianthus annuus TaxID=4232 RepID=A0A9K3GXK6_HELAN|nr:hypothetical protein HanXRQr2_Chr16g0732251 [Helianthus annuus]KAJ0436999.1 hypothetical protein HanHA300_Chr16g0597031 [Helianthus annuus]KAJ0441321.1 hypothetical protein HanIR_Chr16g0796421 [Helianthus annuus]KAJ0459311.1 hypothetical protein HanHA89_Chr16g0647521 [Helianthus annuus]KAJ0643815.1 hypothetical protein HanOQP8_Chr16g0604771 [Helianthus annuus]
MDLKHKLEGRFGKEFAEPPKEYTATDKAQMDKEHEEAIDRYIQNLPHTVNQKRKQKEVVIKNVGAEKNYGLQDLPVRYVIKTGTYRSDHYGNRTGIQCWVYTDENGMFLVKRGNGKVEYYANSSDFESWTTVDLLELSRAPCHDQYRDYNCKIGCNFYNKLQRQALVNFKDMNLAQSFIKVHEDVIDPSTNQPLKTVMWPPTTQAKTIPLL